MLSRPHQLNMLRVPAVHLRRARHLHRRGPLSPRPHRERPPSAPRRLRQHARTEHHRLPHRQALPKGDRQGRALPHNDPPKPGHLNRALNRHKLSNARQARRPRLIQVAPH